MEKLLIKDLSSDNKPRERLLLKGAEALSDAELLAIIFRTGYKSNSALNLAYELLKQLKGLKQLFQVPMKRLTAINGIGTAKATTILAINEISKRIHTHTEQKEVLISTPKDAYMHLRKYMYGKKQEHLYLLALDAKKKVLKTELISIGGVSESLFPIRELIKKSLENEAVSVVIAHNHPSQDPTPSSEDITATHDIKYACKLVGLNFLDHIIVTDHDFFSLKNTNLNL